jgi:hypothetical protein
MRLRQSPSYSIKYETFPFRCVQTIPCVESGWLSSLSPEQGITRPRLIFFYTAFPLIRVKCLSLRMTLDPEIAIETLNLNDGVCH